MEEALKEVKRNRGAAGIDGVSIRGFEYGLEDNVQVLQRELREKSYKPRPVKRVYIPKPDGTKRPLGIPTVRDRVVQASVRRILEPIFEAKFLDCSFGFRPNRSAHLALEKIRKDLMDGYVYVIDADLKSYFDTIPHEKLISLVREEVVDGSVIKLLKSFLQAGIMEGGSFHLNEKGTPQGGVISPLLANIYLHPLDELMTERGHRITRYADDFVICCKSQKGAERVLKSVTKFLEQELGLIVHPEKTKIVDNLKESFVFLGHEFKKGYWVNPSDKALMKFKSNVKDITRRNRTVNIERLVKDKLNPYLRGWGNYFGHWHVKKLFLKFDSWIRRRLRAVQLRSWRKIRKLHRELRRRKWEGELPQLRMFAWRSSSSPPVHYALPNEWFREIGLVFLVDIYNEHHPQRG
ncbi:Retron-type reverse transcriptase [Schinkia azotoformans MEV2011]|uniref:Retron-type reverse transcriptase n=2 Tax=Schinkia azotoformans TaxID=1454 RepID=A0A072NDT1_SCHAZ|nr:group II intron reverse transcriptase/maturase [Schinkia azotoformans]KEF35844.1 Retron-type reverse transcriptase [Schinkia azotoformans MEV2011]MEC1727609.1 group II intron reverse transcriptase/maturase [Schinkia azotoformans]MEC1782348.1 group II intron reverse transcriptase/maturase [Schinkia azotoformans]MED4330984.1 group II intron reverse transcriptase/maturase [Schinkia azotoformans]